MKIVKTIKFKAKMGLQNVKIAGAQQPLGVFPGYPGPCIKVLVDSDRELTDCTVQVAGDNTPITAGGYIGTFPLSGRPAMVFASCFE